MLICWQPQLFYAHRGPFKEDGSPATIKLYKCTIMLQWCLSAALKALEGLVGSGVGWGCTELMRQNIDKTPEGKAAAGWRDISHLGEVFIFTARAVKKKKKVEWKRFRNSSIYQPAEAPRQSRRINSALWQGYNCSIKVLVMLDLKDP